VITIRVDPKAALGMLSDLEQRQLPYAVSLALNRVANKAQAAEREHIKKSFRLRKETFVLQGVKISKQDRANKTSWRVIISLAYPDDRQFLAPHEKGGDKVRHGGKRLWQPNPEVFKSKIIGRSNPLNPKNLALKQQPDGRIQGKERTFLVRSKGQVLVLQRVAQRLSKRSSKLSSITLDNVHVGIGPRTKKAKALSRTAGVRLLYRLVSRVPIKARLQFTSTITHTAQAEWPSVMREAMADAIKGAK